MYNSVRHLKRPSVLTCGIASAEPSSNDGPNCNTVNTPQQHKRWDTFAIALLLTLLQFCFCYNISTALFMFRSFAGCVSTNVYLVCTVWRGLRNGLGKRVNWRNGSTIRCISNSGDTPAPPLKARFCHHQRPLCVAMRSTPAFHRKCPVNEHEIAKKILRVTRDQTG